MHLHTKKQLKYFKEVIKLHYEKGYGEDRISRILPIGHATVSRWIAIFTAENNAKAVPMLKTKIKLKTQPTATCQEINDVKVLQAEVARLQAELQHERFRADAYDEMINVAESKFNVSIRKKAGAKL